MSKASSLRGTAAVLVSILVPCAAVAARHVEAGDEPVASLAEQLQSFPADVQAIVDAPLEEVLYDEADGVHWASGTTYKARFDGEGATIVPFLGSAAPRNFPLAFRAEARLGGAPIGGAGRGVARAGSLVEIDHGGFVEQYLLEPEALEQRFVFDDLPRAADGGDLVVRLALETELGATDLGPALRFENEFGAVEYGEAFAIDAAGERIALDSTVADGAIELVVPAAFVATAKLPLVVDPFIVTVSSSNMHEIQPDVSYDLTTDKWCVVWTRVVSQSDHDVTARLISGNGLPTSTAFPIDFTFDVWTTPKIANNNETNTFLVVAARVPFGSGTSEIAGRILSPGAGVQGPVFKVSPNDGAYRNLPDVGGSQYPQSPSYFCVVWQRSASSTNVDIEGTLVSPIGTPGATIFLESSLAWHEVPSISNSAGRDLGTGDAKWTVVWQSNLGNDHDIWGAQIAWNGTIVRPQFPISLSGWDDTAASVSTMLDPGSGSGSDRPYMVVFQRKATAADHDIVGVVLEGASVKHVRNLSSSFESTWAALDQGNPSVDSDGSQFAVGYEERFNVGTGDFDVLISDYYWMDPMLVACRVHEALSASAGADSEIALHSAASSGGMGLHYGCPFTMDSGSTSGLDTKFGTYLGCFGGLIRSVCGGDGTTGPCPCGNVGATGHGCGNSVHATGARLAAGGAANVGFDSLELEVTGMPPTATCLFFQTATLASGGFGQAFGDGLRCAVGPAIRIGLHAAVDGASIYPLPGESAVSTVGLVPSIGGARYYQVWYRDPASFCTTTTFNVTNALEVHWTP